MERIAETLTADPSRLARLGESGGSLGADAGATVNGAAHTGTGATETAPASPVPYGCARCYCGALYCADGFAVCHVCRSRDAWTPLTVAREERAARLTIASLQSDGARPVTAPTLRATDSARRLIERTATDPRTGETSPNDGRTAAPTSNGASATRPDTDGAQAPAVPHTSREDSRAILADAARRLASAPALAGDAWTGARG